MFKRKKPEIKSSSSHLESPSAFSAKKKPKSKSKSKAAGTTPFIIERNLGESLKKRAELLSSYRDTLGPPDLVHLSRRHGSRESGQFHHVTGLDTSSIAAPVAYLTKMVYNSQFESSDSSSVASIGTYQSWNCFGKVDMRCRTEFPGQKTTVQLVGIDGKVIDQPNVGKIKQEVWEQTYLSAIMRNVLFSDNLEAQRPALVQNTLISTKSTCKKVIDLIVRYLPMGQLTGCAEQYTEPSFLHNYLVDALLKILQISELYDYALQLVKAQIGGNFSYHVIYCLLLSETARDELLLVNELGRGLSHYMGQEIAVGSNSNNFSDFYLVQQSQILAKKNKPQPALYLATKAVERNPTEFVNWINLLEMYIAQRDVKNALLTLNSCPVHSVAVAQAVHRIKEEHVLLESAAEYRFPEPSEEGFLDQVWSEADKTGPVYLKDKDTLLSADFASELELKTVDPVMLKLSGPKLKGTFRTAYNYLSSLAVLVGWDTLLRTRAEVFVMEGEFQNGAARGELKTSARGRQVMLKNKRLCERWLDSLFFLLYDDLKVVSIWEAEALKTGNSMQHSTIEWELIGITAYRAKHYDLAISALRTCLRAKFSIIAAKNLLSVFEDFFGDYDTFKRLNVNAKDSRNLACKDLLFVGSNNQLYPGRKDFIVENEKTKHLPVLQQLLLLQSQSLENNLYLDLILEVLIKIFSWNFRWYQDFSIDCLIFLKRILKENEKDLVVNKLKAGFESEGNAVRLLERYISWIEMFES